MGRSETELKGVCGDAWCGLTPLANAVQMSPHAVCCRATPDYERSRSRKTQISITRRESESTHAVGTMPFDGLND
jgi:hypothetical protein